MQLKRKKKKKPGRHIGLMYKYPQFIVINNLGFLRNCHKRTISVHYSIFYFNVAYKRATYSGYVEYD